jgi:hypothetical protein
MRKCSRTGAKKKNRNLRSGSKNTNDEKKFIASSDSSTVLKAV